VAKMLEISDYHGPAVAQPVRGLNADDAKELRRLKDENIRLERVAACLAVDKAILREAVAGN